MKKQNSLFSVLLLGLLLLISLSVSAQDEVDDRATLMAMVADAIDAANDYTSYRVVTNYSTVLDWSAPSLGLGGQNAQYVDTEGIVIAPPSERPNMRHTINITSTEREKPGARPTDFMIGSEVRVIGGQVYVSAEYLTNDDGLEPLPDTWIEVTGTLFRDYPSLQRIQGNWFTSQPPLQHTIARLNQLNMTGMAALEAISMTREVNASGEQIIVATMPPESALRLGIFASADPISNAIFNAIEGEALTLRFVLDGDGNFIAGGYEFGFDVQDLDLSESTDAREGTRVSFNQQITYFIRFSDINAELEPVEVPEDVRDGSELRTDPTLVNGNTDSSGNAVKIAVPPEAGGDFFWWNDAVFYEIFVRSFYDSDNDGIGDLQGLISQLDYLNDGDAETTDDLGITGIWLMPITQSPAYHGYEVSDYMAVDIDYGTNEDFKAFVDEAHARGIRIIVDLVVNHSSSRHPWFTQSARGDERYADYYIWADQAREPLTTPWGASTWYEREGRLYYALFSEFMPDLNYANPQVTQEMYDITEFWLTDMDVDGFRLDAARHIFETGGVIANAPETYAWLADFKAHVKSIKPDALIVGEIWDDTEIIASYVPQSVDLAFEFETANMMIVAALLQRGNLLQAGLTQMLSQYPAGQFAPFLSNHDQPRAMTQLNEDEAQAKVAASLLLTLPGVPFIYYGEEIGMIGGKPDPNIRSPMQWDAFPPESAGFSDVVPWQPVQADYAERNVYLQEVEPDSLLSHYRNLIHARNGHEALRRGTITFLDAGNDAVYAILRETDDESVLVMVNLSGEIVRDYALTFSAEAINVANIQPVLGAQEIAPPLSSDSDVMINDWQPLDLLPPRSTSIVKLR